MLFSSFSCDFIEFVRRVMRCFSCCFRIRDDNHTQVNCFSQPIAAIRKETVDPLASSCVWSVLAHEERLHEGNWSLVRVIGYIIGVLFEVDFIRCVDIVVFDAVVISSEVGYEKPDAQIFETIRLD
ncbi:hypothetical protein HanLR1_Chr17g0680591 [Helianthus annuus]|nr:hypothetical protein HanLR1_Chr17g0680591 [Helianthus annuus]